MFFTCLAIAATATSVLASPIEASAKTAVLPLKHVSNVKSLKSIVDKGQARIRKINGVNAAVNSFAASSGPATNEDASYVASVDIGGRPWSLIVDTGCKKSTKLPRALLIFLPLKLPTPGAVLKRGVSPLLRGAQPAVLFKSGTAPGLSLVLNTMTPSALGASQSLRSQLELLLGPLASLASTVSSASAQQT